MAAALAEGTVIDQHDLPAPTRAAPVPEDDGEELERLLDACHWNFAQVARRLGVNRSTVMRRVRKAGLTPPH